MKAYVLVIKNRQFVEPHVQVCWSNTECADKIISLTNNTLRDGSRVDSLGLALRALDNLGFDVNTYQVETTLPAGGPGPLVPITAAHYDAEEAAETQRFDAALAAFLESIRALQAEYYGKHFKSLTVPTISVDPGGQKYLRIVSDNGTQRSVYCFVDKTSGDILKADGWKRPAKHARGNIFEDAGKAAITPYGVHYRSSRGHRN